MLLKSALRMLVLSSLPLAISISAAAPASAASTTTEVFLANVRLQVDVLAASSRAAAIKAQSDALKHFADDEVKHQGGVLAGLDNWWTHEDTATPAEVASLPLVTGRSVAIDPPADEQIYAPPPGIGVLMIGASETLENLSSLDGTAFDESYKTTQLATLKTLEGLYDSYSHTGDTAALRDMAAKEVAEVRAEITALDQI